MAVELVRKPKRPEFDRERDGNPFDWILKTAQALRVQEVAAIELQRAKTRTAQRATGFRIPQAPPR